MWTVRFLMFLSHQNCLLLFKWTKVHFLIWFGLFRLVCTYTTWFLSTDCETPMWIVSGVKADQTHNVNGWIDPFAECGNCQRNMTQDHLLPRVLDSRRVFCVIWKFLKYEHSNHTQHPIPIMFTYLVLNKSVESQNRLGLKDISVFLEVSHRCESERRLSLIPVTVIKCSDSFIPEQ